MLSNVCGDPVDAPLFEPILDAASVLRAPLLLHPTLPLTAGHLNQYKGLLAAVGYLFDTTTAAARLLLSGVFDRLPDLAVVLGHSGSLLPALAGRMDEEWRRGGLELPPGADGPPSALLRRLYSDTAGGSAAAVEACIAVLGVDKVMFGSDYPFWSAGRRRMCSPRRRSRRRTVRRSRAQRPFTCSVSRPPTRPDETTARLLPMRGESPLGAGRAASGRPVRRAERLLIGLPSA